MIKSYITLSRIAPLGCSFGECEEVTDNTLSSGLYIFGLLFPQETINIGILRMTGEVTDRFNEITLFGIALFWKKQLNSKFIIHFLTYRVERLFNLEFYCLAKSN